MGKGHSTFPVPPSDVAEMENAESDAEPDDRRDQPRQEGRGCSGATGASPAGRDRGATGHGDLAGGHQCRMEGKEPEGCAQGDRGMAWNCCGRSPWTSCSWI